MRQTKRYLHLLTAAIVGCVYNPAIGGAPSHSVGDDAAIAMDAPVWLQEQLPAWVAPYVGKRGMPPPWSDTPGWIGWDKLGMGSDRYQANRFIVYRPETADYLYGGEYTPITPVYRRGVLPHYEYLLKQDPVGRAVREAATPLDKAMQLLRETMPALARHPSVPPCRPGTPADRNLDDTTLLQSGRAWCNEQTRIYVRFCQVLGIPARMVFLHGLETDAHVVAEIYIDGKWRMVDVTWQITFPDAQGRLMSAADVHTTLGRVMAGQAYIDRCRQLLDGPVDALGEGEPDAIRRRLARKIDSPAAKLWIFGLLNYPLPDVAPAVSPAGNPNGLTKAERAAGWRLLFDGHSLAGWRGYNSARPGANWKVIDGALVATAPRTGDLLTTETFRDFELSIEWRIAEAGNGGILYRVGTDERHSYETGPEYQLLDNQKARGREFPTRRAGSLYDLIAPATDTSKPAGEWNETRIVVRGWRIEHWLNGEKLLEADLAGEQGRALIASSKFAKIPKFAALRSGHIALQDYGNVVGFRNIKLRRL